MQEEKALTYLNKLMKIEEYNSLDFSSELDVEKLLKARQYFVTQFAYYGEKRKNAMLLMKIKETLIEFIHAEKSLEARAVLNPRTNKNYTETDSKNYARTTEEYKKAKEEYFEALGEYETYKGLVEYAKMQVDSINQYASFLKQEKQDSKFLNNQQ